MAGPADEGGVFESFLLEQHSPTLRLTSDSNKVWVNAPEAVTTFADFRAGPEVGGKA